MAEADDEGTMMALLGASEEESREIAEKAGVTVANDNAPGQVVLSGAREGSTEAEEIARESSGAAMPLAVAGAFHSPSMEPAAQPFREALDGVELHEPRFPVVSSATPQPFEDVRQELDATSYTPVALARDHPAPCTTQARPPSSRSAPARCSPGLGKRILPEIKVQTPAEELAHA